MYENIIRNWSFIWHLVKREFRGRYAGSVLGMFWALLGPALTILIFLLVFSNIMAMRFGGDTGISEYVIYLCCGIIPWNAFQESIVRSNTVFVDHSNLIKRVVFPKEILIAQIVTTCTLNLIIGFLLLIPVVIILDSPIGISLVYLPLVITLQMLFSFGLGMIFSTLNVFFRDLSQVIGIFLHVWFWLTPIVYPIKIIPEWLSWWMQFNPLAHLMELYRSILMNSENPGLKQFALFSSITLFVVVIGFSIFERLKDEIPDEV